MREQRIQMILGQIMAKIFMKMALSQKIDVEDIDPTEIARRFRISKKEAKQIAKAIREALTFKKAKNTD